MRYVPGGIDARGRKVHPKILKGLRGPTKMRGGAVGAVSDGLRRRQHTTVRDERGEGWGEGRGERGPHARPVAEPRPGLATPKSQCVVQAGRCVRRSLACACEVPTYSSSLSQIAITTVFRLIGAMLLGWSTNCMGTRSAPPLLEGTGGSAVAHAIERHERYGQPYLCLLLLYNMGCVGCRVVLGGGALSR